MVELLFAEEQPGADDRILFPGVGEGPFIEAVLDYCEQNNLSFPRGLACDTHEGRLNTARKNFKGLPVQFNQSDFLDVADDLGVFDYIIGNPPYVPITELAEGEKARYRRNFDTASGRFDLYMLFFEKALRHLDDNGRLVFITPEKFEYTETASNLRELLGRFHLERIEHVSEKTFPGHTTYPTISVVTNTPRGSTTVLPRNGPERVVTLPYDGTRWTESLRNIETELEPTGVTLGDITERISPGMATGADDVFTFRESDLPSKLEPWCLPTVSGQDLEQQPVSEPVEANSVFLCPYDESGGLYPESELGILGKWLDKVHSETLKGRSCYQKGERRWYAWHENPPMKDILQEKLLFRDVTKSPRFWLDEAGDIVPRHSVYYIIPDGVDPRKLQSYLNSPPVTQWLHAKCDHARNEYLRLQSKVLSDLPVPKRLTGVSQSRLENNIPDSTTDKSKVHPLERSDDD
jgi:hypothetical protein